jgi:hypothetical protein
VAAIDDVNLQFINPSDKINMYDGATADDFPGPTGAGSWQAWDMRGWLNRLTWDLLRFQDWTKYGKSMPNPKSNRWGFRDSVTRQHCIAEQNNYMLRKICAQLKIDITGIPGGV